MVKRQLSPVKCCARFARGFTLTEMIIVIGIMTFLLSITFVYTRSGGRQIALYREQARLVSELNRAKSLTIERVQGAQKICGYGISFIDSHTYVLFRDLPIGNSCGNFIYSGTQEDVDIITIDPIVEIQSRSIKDILFVPPDPRIYFNGSPALDEAKIIIGIPGGNFVAISVNPGGQIVVQ